jgi:hypothetical protein
MTEEANLKLRAETAEALLEELRDENECLKVRVAHLEALLNEQGAESPQQKLQLEINRLRSTEDQKKIPPHRDQWFEWPIEWFESPITGPPEKLTGYTVLDMLRKYAQRELDKRNPDMRPLPTIDVHQRIETGDVYVRFSHGPRTMELKIVQADVRKILSGGERRWLTIYVKSALTELGIDPTEQLLHEAANAIVTQAHKKGYIT